MRGAIALNEAGIVHRDIKPDNILVCPAPDGRPGRGVVIDLGLAKVCSYKVLKLTKRHECFGTPGYAAPEQLESDPDLDSRADVFAVGAMLYELLGGRVPYDGRNPVEVRAQMEAPVPHLVVLVPDVPRELADAVMDAIQVDVKLRPGTLTQLLKVVERHLEHGTSPATHAALGHVRGNGLGYDPDWLGLSYVLHRWLQVIAVRTASLSGYLRAASRVLCMRIWTRLRHAFRRDADA
jgi:serine/threonine-protein kinase